MEKQELFNEINKNNQEISSLKEKKRQLEEDYKAICDFIRRSDRQAEDFFANLQTRKNRLGGLNDILNISKTAKKYKAVMGDMLTGKDYTNAKNNIESLHKALDVEKRKTLEEITNIDNKITGINKANSNLQQEIDSIEE